MPDKPRSITYRRLLRYVRPYVKRLAAGVLCGILFAGSTAGILPVLRDVLPRFFNVEERATLTTIVGVAALLLTVAAVRGIGAFLA